MAETTQSQVPTRRLPRPGAWGATLVLLAMIAVFDGPEFVPTVVFAANALLHTAPFILFAVFAVAYLKASGAETLLAKAFSGNQARMIVMAALLGGLSPFCSCEVIPFIAALLAVGAPLGAVMAFWLASPLMDPAMFAITSGTLGWEFAVAKAFSAIGLGMLGGFGTMLFANSPVFTDPLRERPAVGGCCGVKKPFSGAPLWQFWQEADRTRTFRDTAFENGLFLLKWLTLAYVIEAIMLTYVPAELIANLLGGTGLWPIFLGALVGAPAYLNGYAAVPLVDALLAQGMAPGAAMSFVIAGGVSCIPAAVAVWALVKPRVFAAYLSYALVGAVLAGMAWQAIA
ncbi:permease [Roseobacter sp.]|uniref:permease n=1 Tax=Roseobacter sp. TaxID=1907202 RepID=UPI00262C517E|nr:permease [Roseobacter sp.]MDW3183350.1 permease [Roseobacter sp.]